MFLHLRLKMKLIKFVQYRPLKTSKWGNKKTCFRFYEVVYYYFFLFCTDQNLRSYKDSHKSLQLSTNYYSCWVFFSLTIPRWKNTNIVPFHVKLLFPSIYCPELTMCVTWQLKRFADHRTRNWSNFYSI